MTLKASKCIYMDYRSKMEALNPVVKDLIGYKIRDQYDEKQD